MVNELKLFYFFMITHLEFGKSYMTLYGLHRRPFNKSSRDNGITTVPGNHKRVS